MSKLPKGSEWWLIFPVSRGKITGLHASLLDLGVDVEGQKWRERNAERMPKR